MVNKNLKFTRLIVSPHHFTSQAVACRNWSVPSALAITNMLYPPRWLYCGCLVRPIPCSDCKCILGVLILNFAQQHLLALLVPISYTTFPQVALRSGTDLLFSNSTCLIRHSEGNENMTCMFLQPNFSTC